jgi:hypothetical protein
MGALKLESCSGFWFVFKVNHVLLAFWLLKEMETNFFFLGEYQRI